MSTYRLYKLDTEYTTKYVRKMVAKNITDQEALSMLYEMTPDMIHTINFPCHADEWYWIRNEKPCVFIPDQETIDSLLNAKYTITDADALVFPHKMYTVAPPYHATLAPGIGLGPLMVSGLEQEGHRENIAQFLEYLGMPETAKTHRTREMDETEMYRGLSIATACVFDGKEEGRSRISLPRHKIIDVLQVKTPEEFGEVLGTFPLLGVSPLTENELKQQWLSLKLVLALGIYVQAKPEALRSGLPEKARLDGKFYKDASNSVIHTHRKAGTSPEAHYRNWFFRQLSHEKFYRGEHENKARGSRIVFVSDTIVNREQDNETLDG